MRSAKGNSRTNNTATRHYTAMLLAWASMLGTVIVYALFVQWNVWNPSVIWWYTTNILLLGSLVYAFLLMIRQSLNRAKGIWSIALFMLSITPVIWAGSFAWNLIDVANRRGDVVLNLPTKAFGIWLGNWFTVESKAQYPMLSAGQHVNLLHDASLKNTADLVAKMDTHIATMASVLGQSPPPTKSNWVRGSLSGQTGRSVGAWAICDTGPQNTLQYLDKHELAHTTISLLGGTQVDMPMLLAEGWASSQSANRSDAILNLIDMRRSGQAWPLSEFITDNNYGKSIPQTYSHGAPFTWFLLDRFGGPKFLELYQTVRRATFQEDVFEVLETHWKQLEKDFWAWLEAQESEAMGAVTVDENAPKTIIFNRPTDEARWDHIRKIAAAANRRPLPTTAAFQVTHQGPTPYQVQVILEPESAWTALELQDTVQGSEYTVVNPTFTASFTRQADGSFTNNTDQFLEDIPAATQIATLKNFWFRRTNLLNTMQLDWAGRAPSIPGTTIEIHSIREGATKDDLWTIKYTNRFNGMPEDDEEIEFLIDPKNNFAINRSNITFQHGNRRQTQYEFNEMFGYYFASSWTEREEDGNESFSNIAPLTGTAIADTKQQIESVTGSTPSLSQTSSPKQRLVSPLNLAIAWPLLGLVFLGVDILGDRIQIKTPKKTNSVNHTT